MIARIVAGVLAVALILAFLAPVVVKLQDYALGAVVLVGLVLMIADLWQSIGDSRR